MGSPFRPRSLWNHRPRKVIQLDCWQRTKRLSCSKLLNMCSLRLSVLFASLYACVCLIVCVPAQSHMSAPFSVASGPIAILCSRVVPRGMAHSSFPCSRNGRFLPHLSDQRAATHICARPMRDTSCLSTPTDDADDQD